MDGRRILIVDDDRALRLALSSLLTGAGHVVEQAGDGPEALRALRESSFDLVLLDIGLPTMSGLDVLERLRDAAAAPPTTRSTTLQTTLPLVIMMTADDTPEALLRAVRRQAFRYVRKPFAPSAIVEVVENAIAATPIARLPIDVVSARPDWLEVIVPCTLEMVERMQSFVMQLEGDLPAQVRESVGQAFRELLNNAVEWGGRLDPTRTVRISCVRTRRMLIYRIADPGEGFDIDRLRHAAICNPTDDPLQHAIVREEQGLRPGGLGLVITRSLVDELIYNEARNEVLLIKYLD
jgi:CheY-like chemotaxis protein/anti-sigma regulatory factor (Ser/Thr protein kinase)